VAFSSRSAAFTVSFDATPSQADMNGVIGVSLGGASSYNSLAADARFSPAGTLDALNGSSGYQATGVLRYTPGTSYHFRLVVDPVAHRFSLFAAPQGGPEVQVANNFAFRAVQATTSSLDHLGIYAAVGAETVCNVAVQ
jgi:unsaturated chondroitin disaccharide hydrolase